MTRRIPTPPHRKLFASTKHKIETITANIPVVDATLEVVNQVTMIPFSNSERLNSAGKAVVLSVSSNLVGYVVQGSATAKCVAASGPGAVATATPCIMAGRAVGVGTAAATAEAMGWVFDEVSKMWTPQGFCYKRDGRQVCQYPLNRPKFSLN